MLVTGFPYHVQQDADEFLKVFGQVLRRARAVRRLGSAAIDICWVAAGRMDGVLGSEPEAVGHPRGGADCPGSRRASHRDGWRTWVPEAGDILATNGHIHDEVLRIWRDGAEVRLGSGPVRPGPSSIERDVPALTHSLKSV